MNELTGLQEQCLLAIISYIEANERPPTRRELKQILGQKSTNGANQILDALVKKGYIKIDPPAKKRNIVVLNKPSKQLSLNEDNSWT
jgi:SOS-response transcriptional repressor LexA